MTPWLDDGDVRLACIELNAEYLKIAAKRLEQPTLWSQPV